MKHALVESWQLPFKLNYSVLSTSYSRNEITIGLDHKLPLIDKYRLLQSQKIQSTIYYCQRAKVKSSKIRYVPDSTSPMHAPLIKMQQMALPFLILNELSINLLYDNDRRLT